MEVLPAGVNVSSSSSGSTGGKSPAHSAITSSSSSSGVSVVGAMDKLSWSGDGRFVAVSTRNGCLFVYSVDLSAASADAQANALKKKEREKAHSLSYQLLHAPFSWKSMLASSLCVLAAGTLALSTAVGLSPFELVSLATHSSSI